MKDRKTEVSIEVNGNTYNKNGELIDAIAASAKLTKADAGRSAAQDEDSLTIKVNGSDTSKAAIDYNGSSNSTGDDASIETTVEVNVKGQALNTKGELIDAIASGAKLTKADAGRMVNETSTDWLNFEVEDKGDGSAPMITTRSNSKLTKADAGKA